MIWEGNVSMKFEDLSIYLTANLFRTIVNQQFISNFFELSEAKKGSRIAVGSFFFLLTCTGYLLFSRLEVNILTNLIGLFILAVIYKGSIKKKLIIAALTYCLNMACDVIVMIAFSGPEIMKSAIQIYGCITVLLISICEKAIEKLIITKRESEYNAPYWKSLMLIPICSIAMMHYLVVSSLVDWQTVVLEGIGILAINIISFCLYSAVEETFRDNLEKEIAVQACNAYANQLDVITRSQEQIRMLQHDLKYHIRELASMAEKNHIDQMVSYLNDMNQLTSNPDEFVCSGNDKIDSNLNYLLKNAKNRLKDVSANIRIPMNFEKAAFDINIIISNLLDNAITASEKSIEKTLMMNMMLEKSVLYISIKNSYNGQLLPKGDLFLSTKEHAELHGYGLKNVKRIIKKYNGTISISHTDVLFSVDVMLYI